LTTPLALAVRLARVTVTRAAIDANGGGRILLYAAVPGGPLPATPETPIAAAPLGEAALASPACGVVGDVGGLATLTLTPVAAPIVAGGALAFARLVDGAGAGILDLPAGLAGSDMPLIVSDLALYAGGEVQVLSCAMWE
jgi:hypothetical protein